MKERQRLLLHACCGPCATYPLEFLRESYDITVFFYNPNIHPKEEYQRRRDEAKRYIEERGYTFVEGPYNDEKWFLDTIEHKKEPERGKRCSTCFTMRLEAAAEYARAHAFDAFTTTLTVSPYKNYALIAAIGKELENRYFLPFLAEDFKKNDGYRKGIALSKEAGLYRQRYCGCLYSIR